MEITNKDIMVAFLVMKSEIRYIYEIGMEKHEEMPAELLSRIINLHKKIVPEAMKTLGIKEELNDRDYNQIEAQLAGSTLHPKDKGRQKDNTAGADSDEDSA